MLFRSKIVTFNINYAETHQRLRLGDWALSHEKSLNSESFWFWSLNHHSTTLVLCFISRTLVSCWIGHRMTLMNFRKFGRINLVARKLHWA
jgi:hypothetical protein